MSGYITYRDKNEEGELLYFILQKEFPHFTCYVSEIPVVSFVQPIPVTSYRLWVVFQGTLRGFIPSYVNVVEEIKAVMLDMSTWFFENRILMDVKKYRKWKI